MSLNGISPNDQDWLIQQKQQYAASLNRTPASTQAGSQSASVRDAQQAAQAQQTPVEAIKPSGGSTDVVEISAEALATQKAGAIDAQQTGRNAVNGEAGVYTRSQASGAADDDPTEMSVRSLLTASEDSQDGVPEINAQSAERAARTLGTAMDPQTQADAQVGTNEELSAMAASPKRQVREITEQETEELREKNSEIVSSNKEKASDAPVLNKLSEQELMELVVDGTITRTQANAELANRKSPVNKQQREDEIISDHKGESAQDIAEKNVKQIQEDKERQQAKELEEAASQSNNHANNAGENSAQQTNPTTTDAQSAAVINALL